MNKSIEISEKIIEEIKAEYLNDIYIIEPDYVMYRIDSAGKRFYAKVKDNDYQIAPSVTSLFHTVAPTNRYLVEWFKNNSKKDIEFITENSANYGTFLHVVFSEILTGKKFLFYEESMLLYMKEFCGKNDFNYDNIYKWYKENKRNVLKDMFGFITWAQEYKIEPIAIEYPIMDESMLFAGTIDLVCKATIDGKDKIIMVDYKTRLGSSIDYYENDILQLELYKRAWNNEMTLTVEEIYGYWCKSYRLPLGKTVIPYNFRNHTGSDCLYKLDLYLQLFHGDSKNMQIKSKTEFKPFEIDLNSNLDEMFEEISPIDFLEIDNENNN